MGIRKQNEQRRFQGGKFRFQNGGDESIQETRAGTKLGKEPGDVRKKQRR